MRLIRQWWPTACVVAVILYATLSSDPMPEMKVPLFPGFDKLVHAIMFGGLFAAISFDTYRAGISLTCRRLLIYAAIAIAAGGAIEILQMLMHNGRSADILDFLADTAGVIIAFFTAPPAIRSLIKERGVPKK